MLAGVWICRTDRRGNRLDIARRALATTGAIYARWPSKTDLMIAALNHIFQKILPNGEIEALGVFKEGTPTMIAGGSPILCRSPSSRLGG